MSVLPKVAIVGRPNVGKSSLLNMLAGRKISIVEPTPGVTRDRVATELELPPAKKGGNPRWCEVIDTGGYGVYADHNEYNVLTDDIELQIGSALDEAQLIVFVVDAHTGVTPLDEQVAQLLRRRVGKRVPIVLTANKVDDATFEPDALDASRLGFGEPVFVSAETKRGKWDFVDAVADNIDWDADLTEPPPSMMDIAIVGKRNAGKSTFVNALAGSERVIASEMEGTTRDSVDVRFEYEGKVFTAIDTAGVRKRKSVQDDIEYYSIHRTLRSVRRADVVLLIVDATTDISQVDKKLSFEIQKHFKPCVIVLNKWDLVEDQLDPEEYLEYVTDALRGLDYAPIVFTSALDNDHVHEAIELAIKLYNQAGERVGTGALNQCVKEILEQRGPSSKLGTRAKVYYVTQPQTHPPTIVVFVNDPDQFTPSYQRYMLNGFRERLPFEEVPIKLVIRGRDRRRNDDEELVAQG